MTCASLDPLTPTCPTTRRLAEAEARIKELEAHLKAERSSGDVFEEANERLNERVEVLLDEIVDLRMALGLNPRPNMKPPMGRFSARAALQEAPRDA